MVLNVNNIKKGLPVVFYINDENFKGIVSEVLKTCAKFRMADGSIIKSKVVKSTIQDNFDMLYSYQSITGEYPGDFQNPYTFGVVYIDVDRL